MQDKIIQFRAENKEGFSFSFNIEKAVPLDENGKMFITGVASTTNIDHDNERMSDGALSSMVNVVNEKGVPLRIEHNKSDSAIVGKVFKSWLDDRGAMWIKAEIDTSHPAGPILYQSLKNGTKLGFSVGGKVKKAIKEFSEKTGKLVKTFYDVFLDEVSITQRPANYDAWCFAKSITKQGENADAYRNTDHYREFLFENRSLDYMQAFAKSIPEKSWQKVVSPIIINSNKSINMDKDPKDTKETTVKAEETETKETTAKAEDKKEDVVEETKEKFISEKTFDSFKSMVSAGISSLTSLIEKMSKTESKEDTKVEEKSISTEKAEDKKETVVEAEKAETKETEIKEKADGKVTSETDDADTYAIKSAIEKMQSISKAMDSDTKETAEKAEDTKETETTTKSQKDCGLDKLVFAMADAINSMNDKLSKSGSTVLGFEKHIVDGIKKDPEIQTALKDLLKEPGFKKSVSLGGVYMTTKEGRRYSLIAKEDGEKEVQKTEKPKKFSDVYKKEYSSVSEDGAE
jgi:HK97 family phage prohead protease